MNRPLLREFLVIIALLLALLATVVFLNSCGFGLRKAPTLPKPNDHANIGSALVWMVTVSVFGIGASIAAAVFLPMKRMAVAAIAGFGSILGCALLVSAAMPFLPWVALGLILILVIAGILLLRNYVIATHCAVTYGHMIENAETDADVAMVKTVNATQQQAHGVKKIIEGALNKVKGI